MQTDIDICNIAIGRCGSDSTISAFSEQSKEARLCARFYPLARDEVLERVAWPFAVKVAALAPMDGTPELVPGYGYSYALPADAASVIEVMPAGYITDAFGYYTNCACDAPWMPCRKSAYAFRQALSADGNSRVILAGIPDAYAVYVAKVTNAGLFSALMASLVADRLAMELSLPLTGDVRWFQLAAQRYNSQFLEVVARQLEQDRQGPRGDAPAIAARA